MGDSDPQSSQCISVLDMGSKPYQPDPKFIEVQHLPNNKLRFQEKWYSQYSWLHSSPTLKKIETKDKVGNTAKCEHEPNSLVIYDFVAGKYTVYKKIGSYLGSNKSRHQNKY